MNSSPRISLLLIFVLCGGASALLYADESASPTNTKGEVKLYLKPGDNQSVGTAVPNQELRDKSEPATEAPDVTPRWWKTQQSITLSGWVQNSDLGKDLEVKEGAAVRVGPSTDADVKFTWAKGNPVEFGAVSGNFTEVESTEERTVYFQPPVSGPRAPEPTPTTPPSRPGAIAPLPDGQPIAPPISSYEVMLEAIKNSEHIRYFNGRFRPVRNFFNLQESYRYEIVQDNNRRIAYVDISSLRSSSPLDRLFSKEVQIMGTVSRVGRSTEYVIKAKTIRLRKTN